MFLASAIVVLILYVIGVVSIPMMVGKTRDPVTGGFASTTVVVNAVIGVAVYFLYKHESTSLGLAFTIVLWALLVFSALFTVARVGKSRKPMTARDATWIMTSNLIQLGMILYLILV